MSALNRGYFQKCVRFVENRRKSIKGPEAKILQNGMKNYVRGTKHLK